MATYLPKDTSPGSAYQEGGGLYALGLIHANHGGDIIDYLLGQLKNASNDVSFQQSILLSVDELGNNIYFKDCSSYVSHCSRSVPYSQIVRHGGALGLGLAALGTARQDVYDLLKSNLYQDDAVTGL